MINTTFIRFLTLIYIATAFELYSIGYSFECFYKIDGKMMGTWTQFRI